MIEVEEVVVVVEEEEEEEEEVDEEVPLVEEVDPSGDDVLEVISKNNTKTQNVQV